MGANETLLAMPQQLWNLTVPINKIDNVIPGEYQLANGIMHAFGMSWPWSSLASLRLELWWSLVHRAGAQLALECGSEN